MLANRKTYGIEIHVLDYKLFAKLICKCLCDLHINTNIVLAIHVLKWLKCCVCCYY